MEAGTTVIPSPFSKVQPGRNRQCDRGLRCPGKEALQGLFDVAKTPHHGYWNQDMPTVGTASSTVVLAILAVVLTEIQESPTATDLIVSLCKDAGISYC